MVTRNCVPFVGFGADGFVLGVLQGSFTPEISFVALKERVLWQWKEAKYFEELQNSVLRLEEMGYILILGDKAHPDTCCIRLVT
jgi:hypothetical protein